MNEKAVKTRFAPSPTGALHLGNLRTALFNVLLARRHGGTFLLRIEDTDRERYRPEAAEALMADLRWLGLEWDEGPGCDGGLGPYCQHDRGGIYAEYYRRLEESGAAYSCFCTPRELELARRAQRAAGRPPRYPGTCARLSADQVAARLEAGERPTLRFRVPPGREVVFEDLVHGPQRFATDDLGDFVIRRGDGTASYLFANAVDDALMGITHVLRGDDHLTNTPRQALVLEALGLTPPRYGHMGLMLGHDGAPLSKRNGSRSVADLRGEGFLPEAVLNYLARVGHAYEEDRLLDLDRLAAGFDAGRLGAGPSRFDAVQLRRWQGEAVQAAAGDRLQAWMGVDDGVPADRIAAFVEAIRPNVLFPAEAREWAEILFGEDPPWEEEALKAVREAGPEMFAAALAAVEASGARMDAITARVKEQTGTKGRRLFLPLRAALTGRCSGPELQPLAPLMGPEGVARRLRRARRVAEEDAGESAC